MSADRSVKEFIVQLQNNWGTFASLMASFRRSPGRPTVHAFNVDPGDPMAYLRLVPDDPNAAREALEKKGLAFESSFVVAVDFEGDPTGLPALVRALAQAEINVQYVYPFLSGRRGSGALVAAVESVSGPIGPGGETAAARLAAALGKDAIRLQRAAPAEGRTGSPDLPATSHEVLVFCGNRFGVLRDVLRRVETAGVELLGIQVRNLVSAAELRLLVDRPNAAIGALAGSYHCVPVEVVAVDCSEGVEATLRRLYPVDGPADSGSGFNIRYAYPLLTGGPAPRSGAVVVGVDPEWVDLAVEVGMKSGFRMLAQEDISVQ